MLHFKRQKDENGEGTEMSCPGSSSALDRAALGLTHIAGGALVRALGLSQALWCRQLQAEAQASQVQGLHGLQTELRANLNKLNTTLSQNKLKVWEQRRWLRR